MTLLKFPATWPVVVSATLAMALLATLDLGIALCAKEWALRHTTPVLALGVSLSVFLFWVYASALQYADLAVVTLGWIVLLQVGLIVIDVLRYAARPTPAQWLAVAVILAAQGYLVLSSTGTDLPT